MQNNQNAEKAREIIKAIAEGATLRHALSIHELSAYRFSQCMAQDKELARHYTLALETRSDLMADDVVTIADTEPDAQKAKNMIDARKWNTSKMAPKKYGERIALDVTQSIDIGAALSEARGRLRPISDQSKTIDAQVTDITGQKAIAATDKESAGEFSIFD